MLDFFVILENSHSLTYTQSEDENVEEEKRHNKASKLKIFLREVRKA